MMQSYYTLFLSRWNNFIGFFFCLYFASSFDVYFQPDLTVNGTKIFQVTKLMQGGVYTVVIQLPFDGSTNAQNFVIFF